MKRTQRGAAVILAMLVAALAATVAVALAGAQQRWLAGVESRRDQVQAQSLALAGVQWARQILQEDIRGGTLDHLAEVWAYPLPPTPIANGSIEGRIEDAQGRLNLNNLALTNAQGTAERLRLAQLFAARRVDPAVLDALADWIDADAAARANGAEDAYYQARGNRKKLVDEYTNDEDAEFYVRRLKEVYAQRFVRAVTREDFEALFGENLSLWETALSDIVPLTTREREPSPY